MSGVDKVNVLIVDDKQENLFALEIILKDLDINIIKANSGNNALAYLLEIHFCCILLDVKMPDMDGYELAKIIREEESTKYLPIIFVTGSTQAQSDIFKGYETGAVDYLLKPLDPIIVRSKINIFADLYRKERAREHSEAMLGKYAKDLECAYKELESFSYSVSHDLRAPVRAVIGFCEILLEDYRAGLGPEGIIYVQKIIASGLRMRELIDSLLDLAKISRKNIKFETVDLSAKVKMLVDELQRGDPSRKINTQIVENAVVKGDSRLLTIVLQNLLANAWKFTSKSENVKIEFGLSKDSPIRTFFIKDNGEGFNMNHAQNLFGAFQRLHSDHDFPGTGIGLATVQRIIHRHGGRIWAESTVKQGATFYFTLPENSDLLPLEERTNT